MSSTRTFSRLLAAQVQVERERTGGELSVGAKMESNDRE